MKKVSDVPLESGKSKKHKRHQLWRDLIKSYKESGLRRKEFCNQHGIKADDLDRWRYRLAKLDAINEAPNLQVTSCSSIPKAGCHHFAEVHVDKTLTPEVALSRNISAPPCDFKITLMTGTKITVPSQFNAEALSRLLVCLQGEVTC